MSQFDGIDTRRGIIAWFARNAVAANLLMMIILAVGIWSALNLPRTVQPDFETNVVQITVIYPGAAPEEVESGVILKIEEALKDIDAIERVNSTADESLARVSVTVFDDVNLLTALDEIKSAVDGITNFPVEAEKPLVQHLKFRDHVLGIQVYGNLDERSMKALIEEVRDELLARPEIGYVETYGGRDYEVTIEVPEAVLHKYNLTLNDIAQAVRNSSLDMPGGAIKTASGEVMLRARGQAYQQHDFERIVLISHPDGTRLTLGDIATINDGFAEGTGFSVFNGQFSMGANVYAVGQQDMIAVAENARQYVEEKRQQLPEGVSIDHWVDVTFYLEGRLNMMLKNLALGALLVFLILTLFLDLKLAFWVMVGLPLCFLGAFAVMPHEPVNITLNMISLFGFILVLGIVVDDAIIIGESAGTMVQRKGHSVDAVIAGAKRVAVPATFGVLTTIVAFIPTLLTDGVFSSFPASFGWVVILCLLFSLVESKLILPAHLVHSRPFTKGPAFRLQTFCNGLLTSFIDNYYQPVMKRAIRDRYITLACFIGAMIIAIGLVAGGVVRYIMMPVMPNDFVQASLEMVEGSTEEQTLSAYRQMANALDDVKRELSDANGGAPVIKHVAAYAWGGRNVQFMLELTKNEIRQLDSDEISRRWRHAIGDIPGAKVVAVTTANDMGGGQDVAFKLIGADLNQLQAASNDLVRKLRSFDGAYDIRNSANPALDEVVLSIRPEAEAMGLSLNHVATQVRHAFYGAEAQRIQRGNHEVKVMVRYPELDRRTFSDLENMYIRTGQGDAIPLDAVAEIDIQPGYSRLNRINGRRAVTVGAQVDRDIAEPRRIEQQIINEFLPQLMETYPGVRYQLDGLSEESGKLFGSMFTGFAFALFGIYALLAIPLRSYLQPLVIMSVIPFGIIGAIIGHIWVGIPLDMMSFFGIIALSGVVVNDSLIMVDFINKSLQRGESLMNAVIQSGRQRYRAIMLTSLTTFFGLLPMLLEKSAQAQFLIPMAVSLGFGIIFATVITLILVPCLYVILDDFKGLFGADAESGRQAESSVNA